ncbi:hypothetical protein TSOC_003702 [Tetrabaena socialis]|uniref:Uncharacterized protein n=1 Tax=Tetrabaena socialis TaxID=47790 RepID=A0A2J8AAZ2_9CHLO|nr:hypothetical protein TSOC_003702 [Tetrabaena socialis]|eukprot:PNH09699.1 hypothetical protein TSOC_003702 [Tetrabaena socialis]
MQPQPAGPMQSVSHDRSQQTFSAGSRPPGSSCYPRGGARVWEGDACLSPVSATQPEAEAEEGAAIGGTKEPEAFRPERFLPESAGRLGTAGTAAFAPLGVGPHCVGDYVGAGPRMAAKSALVQLYRRFTFSLHAKQRLPLRMRTAMTHAPRDGVWVSVHAR